MIKEITMKTIFNELELIFTEDGYVTTKGCSEEDVLLEDTLNNLFITKKGKVVSPKDVDTVSKYMQLIHIKLVRTLEEIACETSHAHLKTSSGIVLYL